MIRFPSLTLGPIRVIAIDDNLADLESLGRVLSVRPLPKIEYHGLRPHNEVMAEIKDLEPDVLLMDYKTGQSTSIDFLRKARSQGIHAPAILLTGQGDEEIAVEALQGGFADYMTKGVVTEKSIGRSIVNVIEKKRLLYESKIYRNELEATIEQLQSKNREISSFYHTLAHELKTPLTGAREFISIVIDEITGPVNPKQAELLGRAMGACDQLKRNINDLFDTSRIETGKLQVNLEDKSLCEVVAQAVACQESPASEAGLTLLLEVASAMPDIAIDEQRIKQVVQNLLGNAIKFTPRGGEIKVKCELNADEQQYISVQDSGKGIASSELDQVFERL